MRQNKPLHKKEAGYMSHYSFEVDRKDLTKTQFVTIAAPEEVSLAGDETILRVDKFALTANNITYGVAGDMIGYWQFFPAADSWGRIPVWGMGTVIRSASNALRVGDEYYGYFPMSSYLKVSPTRVTERGFVDNASNRQPLPPVYNQYSLMTSGNGFNRAVDDQQMVYRPLFTTSFVLDDYLFDNQFFGAGNIILGSASSKTAFGLAFLLNKNRNVRVTGLTSKTNRKFVESLGIYDAVVTYDEIASLDNTEKVAYVDMAGNRSVLQELHHHYEDNMVCSCGVGITHWESRDGEAPAALPGAKPSMFFAPNQIQKRNKEWGAEKFQSELNAAWTDFLGVVDAWVTINHPAGRDGVQNTYETVLNGAPPNESYVVAL